MACVDHTCADCKAIWSDNYSSSECPECGCQNHTNHYADECLEDVPNDYREENSDESDQ